MAKINWEVAEAALTRRIACDWNMDEHSTRDEVEEALMEEAQEFAVFETLREIAEKHGDEAVIEFVNDPNPDYDPEYVNDGITKTNWWIASHGSRLRLRLFCDDRHDPHPDRGR